MKRHVRKAAFRRSRKSDTVRMLLALTSQGRTLDEGTLFKRRLVLHEAVLNAVMHGGKPISIRIHQSENKITVKISQRKNILWPEKAESYKGVELIKRFSDKCKISKDKKTLTLSFC